MATRPAASNLARRTPPQRRPPARRYAEAEKTNGRWAMAAVAGMMGQELAGAGKWFEAGVKEYPIDFLPLLALEFVIMGFLETKRYKGFKNTGSVRRPSCSQRLCVSRRLSTAHGRGEWRRRALSRLRAVTRPGTAALSS